MDPCCLCGKTLDEKRTCRGCGASFCPACFESTIKDGPCPVCEEQPKEICKRKVIQSTRTRATP